MTRLVVDVGNTDTKVVGLDLDGGLPDLTSSVGDRAGPVTETMRFPTSRWKTDPEACLQKLSHVPDAPLTLVSVVPLATRHITAAFPDTIVATGELYSPLQEVLENPQTVGPDRSCNMAAALGAGLRDALVVDAGTATTIDLLRNGYFAGGLIMPGMATAARAMTDQGAMLPEIAFGPAVEDIGRNTTQALERGAWLAGRGAIEWTLGRLQEKYGLVPVVLTGGFGAWLHTPERHHDQHWTLRGAAWLAHRTSQNRS